MGHSENNNVFLHSACLECQCPEGICLARSIAKFYAANADQLRSYFFGYFRDKYLADEAMSEFGRILMEELDLKTLKDIKSPQDIFYKLRWKARNVILDILRKRKRLLMESLESFENIPTPGQEEDFEENKNREDEIAELLDAIQDRGIKVPEIQDQLMEHLGIKPSRTTKTYHWKLILTRLVADSLFRTEVVTWLRETFL